MNVTDRLASAAVAAWCGAGCAAQDVTAAAVAYVAYGTAAVWWGFTGAVAAIGWDTIRRARGDET